MQNKNCLYAAPNVKFSQLNVSGVNMSVEATPIIFSYTPIKFAERISQNPLIEMEKGEQLEITDCKTNDVIKLINAKRDISIIIKSIIEIFNQYLSVVGYQCEAVVCEKVVVHLSKRQFTIVGPFIFKAQILCEVIPYASLMQALSLLPRGEFLTFSHKSIVVISGFEARGTEAFCSKETKESVTLKMNEIMKSRYAGLVKHELNFFVGPPYALAAFKQSKTLECRRMECISIQSNGIEEIRIGFLNNDEFKKELSEPSAMIPVEQAKVPGTST